MLVQLVQTSIVERFEQVLEVWITVENLTNEGGTTSERGHQQDELFVGV